MMHRLLGLRWTLRHLAQTGCAALLLAGGGALAAADDLPPTGPTSDQSFPMLPRSEGSAPAGASAPTRDDLRAPLTVTVTQTPVQGGQVMVSADVESAFDSDDVTVTWDLPRALPTLKDLSRGAIRRLRANTHAQSAWLLAHPDQPYKITVTIRAHVPGSATTYFSQQATVIVTPDGSILRALPSDEEHVRQHLVADQHGARVIQHQGQGGVNQPPTRKTR